MTHAAFLPVSTYMVISAWPRSGAATIWETDLTRPLTEKDVIAGLCSGDYEDARRVLFVDEQQGVFTDVSAEIAQELGEEIVRRSTSNGKISKSALAFCEIHSVSIPAYLNAEVA